MSLQVSTRGHDTVRAAWTHHAGGRVRTWERSVTVLRGAFFSEKLIIHLIIHSVYLLYSYYT